MSHIREDRGHTARGQQHRMERLQNVLFRTQYLSLVIIAAVVLLTFLDPQFIFLQWTLPSVATAAWVALSLVVLLQVILAPRLPPAIRGQFTAPYLAIRGTFVLVGCGIVVWLIWSAYGPL